MNLTVEFATYLLTINLVSGILFAYDKQAAKKNKPRIPEITLHVFELLGGVFANIFLMYSLRHKNRKFSYWLWTWLIMSSWIVIFTVLIQNDYKIISLISI
ncbi:MAG: DUF1294 domain-containing protein [Paludibacter sp.]|nr:DUF1294 domain-containing protein [Paludibacter sp.]